MNNEKVEADPACATMQS